ncbi:MAG: hypothetical protein QHH14_01610 [Clostridiales bacterium]|nr:hypothetical protein [Clostridiales bacterium]
MPERMHRQGLRVLKAEVGVVSNEKSLLLSFPLPLEVKSLLTDFKEIKNIPYPSNPDGRISIYEVPGAKPSCRISGQRAFFRGPFVSLTRRASDLRYSLWGNQGFFYRFALYLLERNHQVYSLHACGLFQAKKNRLVVIAGGAGSGKTVYLLSGLAKGLKLFSTETVHFTIKAGRFLWFMGSLVDNVRIETIRRHFSEFWPAPLPANQGTEWHGKIAIDLSSYKCPFDTLKDPDVVIIFPRIEEGRDTFLLSRMDNAARRAKALFDNISEKLAETVVLYDKVPAPGLDNPDLARARLRAAETLARSRHTRLVASVLSSPDRCWGGLLSERYSSQKGAEYGE